MKINKKYNILWIYKNVWYVCYKFEIFKLFYWILMFENSVNYCKRV